MPAEESCPSGSRATTFRHLTGQSVQRSEWFDWGSSLGSTVAANPKFLAVALEGGSGGKIVVGTHDDFGKEGRLGLVHLQDHTGAVSDIKWDNFNDNVLASCSADCTVKIWHITDQMKTQCVRTLTRHSRRVDQIEWHTTVDNVLLSAGSDCKLILWDVEASSVIFEISDFLSSCIAFAPNSSIFAATSRQTHR
ncbi:WD domain, G-beta repeat protein [Cooperia oncophora]